MVLRSSEVEKVIDYYFSKYIRWELLQITLKDPWQFCRSKQARDRRMDNNQEFRYLNVLTEEYLEPCEGTRER